MSGIQKQWEDCDGTNYDEVFVRRGRWWVFQMSLISILILFLVTYPFYYIIIGLATRALRWFVYGIIHALLIIPIIFIILAGFVSTDPDPVLYNTSFVLSALFILFVLSAALHFVTQRKSYIEKLDFIERKNAHGEFVNRFDEWLYKIRTPVRNKIGEPFDHTPTEEEIDYHAGRLSKILGTEEQFKAYMAEKEKNRQKEKELNELDDEDRTNNETKST